MKPRPTHSSLVALLCLALQGCSTTSPSGEVSSASQSASRANAGTSSMPVGSPSTISGVIGDSMCGMNHEGMLKTGSMGDDDTSCTIKCVEAGSKFVLVNSTGTVYKLSDQQQSKKFAGRKVNVKGLVDNQLHLITVQQIQVSEDQ